MGIAPRPHQLFRGDVSAGLPAELLPDARVSRCPAGRPQTPAGPSSVESVISSETMLAARFS
jgi:hypothetical protein